MPGKHIRCRGVPPHTHEKTLVLVAGVEIREMKSRVLLRRRQRKVLRSYVEAVAQGKIVDVTLLVIYPQHLRSVMSNVAVRLWRKSN
jgi:hypothetical protein